MNQIWTISFGAADLIRGWKRSRLWFTLARDEIRLRYQRSVLGPLWITLGTGFFIAVVSVIWTEIMGKEARVFVPWFAIGLTMWQLFLAIISEGPMTFSRVSGIIHNIPMPFSVHVYCVVMRNVINYFHNFVIVILVLILFPPQLTGSMVLFIPGFLIIVVAAVAVSIILGILGARFRDFSYTVSMVMGPMFFLTPILWMPDMLTGSRLQLSKLNPFTHFLAIIREPLLGREPALLNYAITIGISVMLMFISLHMLGRHRAKVPYWI
ncbi:MAG: ABC transporter permease [Nitrospirales bacterium]|nr:ABC transporter permease [Nitrospirales bacterium]